MNRDPAQQRPNGSMLTLSEWAQNREPSLVVTAKSEPEPVMLSHNLVAVVRDPSVSRELLRKWERIEHAGAGVGFVAMSRTPSRGVSVYDDPDRRPPVAKTDPQHVTGHAARKIVRGALPGGVIGAIVIGVIAAILTPDGGNVTAALLAGGAIGFVAGAVISFVAGTGWSKAYEESFVEAATTEVTFASVHSDDSDVIARAAKAADIPRDALLALDREGHAVPFDGASG